MPERPVVGWDLGGAHLKVAVAERGRLLEVAQVPCPLWQGLEHLIRSIDQVRPLVETAAVHGITMTGELVDLFENRSQGVARLIEAMTQAFPGRELRIYAGRSGFLTPREAGARPDEVASANWLASASFAAARLEEALFIDIGSTTTDILPIAAGQVEAHGLTDAARLTCEELVYTGVTRTPVMALTDAVPFEGARQRIMAEHFATAADVHRLTGQLPEDADQHPAADGGAKDETGSARRLARMLGRDLESANMAAWRRLASYLAERQLQSIQDAAACVLSRSPIGDLAPVVGAGIGRFLAAELAARSKRPYRDFAALVEGDEMVCGRAACCAPAAAVALLARGSG
ncbi:MAG: hydantoinase/oxoprolinase [Rhodospirillales bacterium]|nr:hydantoinase/oxoprolinase [Rhodospirillales bacterium]